MGEEVIKCPKCSGKGGLVEKLKQRSGDDKSRLKKCPICKGKGFINGRWTPRK